MKLNSIRVSAIAARGLDGQIVVLDSAKLNCIGKNKINEKINDDKYRNGSDDLIV